MAAHETDENSPEIVPINEVDGTPQDGMGQERAVRTDSGEGDLQLPAVIAIDNVRRAPQCGLRRNGTVLHKVDLKHFR